ncbi:cupin domain-containing protein [Aeoliella sp.]|uniref:cupin domain-containing protein n=1 Tax=Aeoliella sp. TaxID=2795800 RepID=UPI003CCBBFA3
MHDQPTTVFESGPMSHWKDFRFQIPGLPATAKGFLKDRLGMSGMEVSLNVLGPGDQMPFLHRHRENEELYLFLSGTGEFQADAQLFPIVDGTCVRCAPAVKRSWRNTGTTDLHFVVIQAPNTPTPGSMIDDGEIVSEPPQWNATNVG